MLDLSTFKIIKCQRQVSFRWIFPNTDSTAVWRKQEKALHNEVNDIHLWDLLIKIWVNDQIQNTCRAPTAPLRFGLLFRVFGAPTAPLRFGLLFRVFGICLSHQRTNIKFDVQLPKLTVSVVIAISAVLNLLRLLCFTYLDLEYHSGPDCNFSSKSSSAIAVRARLFPSFQPQLRIYRLCQSRRSPA